MFYKEFPEISINKDYVNGLADYVIKERLWESIRVLKKRDKFGFEFNAIDAAEDTDPTRVREYLAKVVYAYRLNPAEMELAGIKSESAWLFKTNPLTRVYIHRESRAIALNFPIKYLPKLSYVGFYDDNCVELDRHTVIDDSPVYYNVEQWHTVMNMSNNSPRIVLTCSDLQDEWKKIVYEHLGIA